MPQTTGRRSGAGFRAGLLARSRTPRPVRLQGRSPAGWRASLGGWTLSELLIVLAILALLLGLALPSHLQQQRQARRADARAGLQMLLLDQARHRSLHGTFATDLASLGWPHERSPQGHYRLRITEASTDSHVAEAWPEGAQAADSACQPLRLSLRDAATLVHSSGASSDSDPGRCWP